MRLQAYAQTTPESCLSCCLLQVRFCIDGKKINLRDEQKMLVEALKSNRWDFVGGHLRFFEKSFPFVTTRYVHNRLYQKWLLKHSHYTTIQQKIDLPFIDKAISSAPLILVIDHHIITQFGHYPHWIVIYQKKKKGYVVYDPWIGKKCLLPSSLLKKGIESFLTRLWMAPQAIVVKEKR